MLRLRTLGGLSIENSGSKSPSANRRPLALLALLAANGPRGLSRDKVVALLWPESDSEHGRNSLSQVLSALRRELTAGDPVLGALELRVNTDVLTCDVMEFEERIAANELEAATQLYTGPFLDGVFLKNTPEFERWVEQQRSRLERLQGDALERLATRATEREDHLSAAALWRRRATLAPNDSRAALKLMESLVASGEPASALAHYRVHQSLLREDVGIEPDATLTEFATKLRRANGRSADVPSVIPRQDTSADSGGGAHAEVPHDASIRREEVKVTGLGRIGSRRVGWIVAVLVGISLSGVALARRNTAREEPASPIQRLAVLPLLNQTGDTAVNGVADALTQELISSLLRAGVPVIGYYSVNKYRGTSGISLADVGRKLNVDAVATWVVSRQGSELRIALEVASPSSGEGLWASTEYTVDSLRLPDVAVAAARELATHLARRGVVATRTPVPLASSSSSSSSAKMAYLIGMQTFYRNPTGFKFAMGEFQQAISEDSSYADAWAGLGFSYIFAIDYGNMTANDACANARPAIQRAVKLDSALSLAHLARARMLQDCDWNWKGAEAEYRTAIALEPSATNYQTFGWLLEWYLGRTREGVAMGDTAVARDPGSVLAHLALAWRLRGADDLDRAESEANVAIVLDPSVIDGHWILAEVYLRRRDFAKAEREALEVKARGGSPPSLTTLGEIYARTGRIKEARAYIRLLMETQPVTGPARVAAARTQMALGDRDAALTTLEQAVRDRIFIIPYQPYWDPIRNDPRFKALMHRMGL